MVMTVSAAPNMFSRPVLRIDCIQCNMHHSMSNNIGTAQHIFEPLSLQSSLLFSCETGLQLFLIHSHQVWLKL